MSVLSDFKASVTTALRAAGVTSFEFLPERINPPAAVVLPGSPYVEAGDVYGTHKVNATVSLVAGNGTNDTATAALDNLIGTAVLALWDVADVTEVSDLYAYNANGAQYLAVDISISDTISFK